MYEDDGWSGATLVRPGLKRVRDLRPRGKSMRSSYTAPIGSAASMPIRCCCSEEFARAGVDVVFVRAPRIETPEEVLLVQFQGMIAEYEKAQMSERTRRGKRHRARCGVVNVLSGAPYGYRYVRQPDPEEAISPAKLGPGRRSLVHGELLVQGEVLQGELAVAAADEREESK